MPLTERVAEQKFLIAVDFGTTFSSALWQHTSEADGQHVIQDWPNGDHAYQPTTDTVPTTLRYDINGYRWGYQINSDEERYEWFKLGLDPSMQRHQSSLASRYPGTRQLPLRLSSRGEITPEKLTTQYLEALCDHVEYMVRRIVLDSVFRSTQREYVISVPAVWTEKARDLTAKCAVNAGMGSRDKLHIVSEPEAAAIYAISKFKEINIDGLKADDTFVLCDAGGGTVDLISYTILNMDPIPELEEAAPGSGSACGSIFLNRIFADTLNRRFGGRNDWDSEPEILDTAMEHFERVTKNEFSGRKGCNIPMRGIGPRPDIKHHRLELTLTEMQNIFEPVISEILTLIQRQIQETENNGKKVKLILLVGGFGNSPYLQRRIQDNFEPQITVKVSPDSQTAVVRGALMRGLAEVKGLAAKLPRIRARRARHHYGTECVIPYKRRQYPGDDGHSPVRKMSNPYLGQDHVEVMRWFLQKGDVIEENEPKTFEFSTDQLVSAGRTKEISIDIFRQLDPSNQYGPKYKNNDVEKLGTVTIDVQSIDLKQEQGRDGNFYYVMNFDIEMRCLETKLEFTPIYLYGDHRRMRCKPAAFQLE